MNRPDHSGLAPLRRMDGDPVFDEPWQAQALAMADGLVSAGIVEPQTWSQTLGRELRDRIEKGSPDDVDTYYAAVLAALERLVGSHGGISQGEIASRREAWRQAYLDTPHGQPVELKS